MTTTAAGIKQSTLKEPTAIWFDDGEPVDSSCGYCIAQIKDEITRSGGAVDVETPADADILHLNTIPFRRQDIPAVRSDTPVVVTQHGGYHWWQSRRELLSRSRDRVHLLVRAIHRLTGRAVDQIAFSTDYTRRLAVRRGGIPRQLTHVIPLGCGPEYRNTAPTDTDDPFILTVVNNDNPRKNIPTIIETIREMPAVRFVLPGKMWGEYPETLPDNAHVTGFIDESELIDYYNRASAVYIPTLYEGFGLPFVEAMSCGTAVVTTERGAPLEVCDTAGIYVSDAFDADEHARILWRLITDDEFRSVYERRGLKRAEAFSWERTANAYRRVYNEVLYGNE